MAAEGTEKLLDLARRKLEVLQRELFLATDGAVKFRLREQIKELKQEIDQLLQRAADELQLESFPTSRQLIRHVESIIYDDGDRGVLQRVNCDRNEPLKLFWKAYDAKASFYFITACDYQMPQQFCERLFYEFRAEEEPEQPKFWSRPNERLILDPLPLGRNLERSKAKFDRYIARKFELEGGEPMEEFLTAGIDELGHDVVFLPFYVQEGDWKDFLPDYYRWVMELLAPQVGRETKFLVTFAHFSRDIHLADCYTERHQALIDVFDELEAETPTAKHIQRLKPVPVKDLEEWLYRMGVANLQSQQKTVEIIAASLPPKERARYEAERVFNMTHIDLAQDIICKHLNR